jgi:hypothetical protein
MQGVWEQLKAFERGMTGAKNNYGNKELIDAKLGRSGAGAPLKL